MLRLVAALLLALVAGARAFGPPINSATDGDTLPGEFWSNDGRPKKRRLATRRAAGVWRALNPPNPPRQKKKHKKRLGRDAAAAARHGRGPLALRGPGRRGPHLPLAPLPDPGRVRPPGEKGHAPPEALVGGRQRERRPRAQPNGARERRAHVVLDVFQAPGGPRRGARRAAHRPVDAHPRVARRGV